MANKTAKIAQVTRESHNIRACCARLLTKLLVLYQHVYSFASTDIEPLPTIVAVRSHAMSAAATVDIYLDEQPEHAEVWSHRLIARQM